MAETGDLAWLSAPDRRVVSQQAFAYEGAKNAAELHGCRPRRFVILSEVTDDLDKPPPAGTKRLRLVRHGEGHHNVFRAAEFAAGRTPTAKRGNFAQVSEELFDPALTAEGEAEGIAARSGAEAGRDPELLVTSPLRRACKTGLLAFQRAVASGIPVIAHELARECYKGLDPSIYDAHRSREDLAKEFPGVDFHTYVPAPRGPGLQGDPNWWYFTSPCGAFLEAGEDLASHTEKAWHLMCWLMDRPERDIALATHSLFLLALYHGALAQEDKKGRPQPPSGVQIFRTGELRSVLVAERQPTPRPWWTWRPEGMTTFSAMLTGGVLAGAAVSLVGMLRSRSK